MTAEPRELVPEYVVEFLRAVRQILAEGAVEPRVAGAPWTLSGGGDMRFESRAFTDTVHVSDSFIVQLTSDRLAAAGLTQERIGRVAKWMTTSFSGLVVGAMLAGPLGEAGTWTWEQVWHIAGVLIERMNHL